MKRRFPQPFYRKQTASWYVQLHGKQVPLGDDETAAWQEYHRIMSGERELAPITPIVAVCDQFLTWVENNQAPATYKYYIFYLAKFAKYIGKSKRVSDLKPYHVTRWVDQDFVGQSDSSKAGAYRSVQRVFNWAVKQGILPTSPVTHLDKPTPGRRETYVTPEQYLTVLERVRESERGEGPFYNFIVTLWETGCRSMEIRGVTAANYHADRGVWIFERKKSKGKKRRRVVYLTPRVIGICDRLVKTAGKGPLFRNSRGVPWTQNSINCRFMHLMGKKESKKAKGKKPLKKQRKKLTPLSFPVHAYAFRHGFATDRLLKGIDSTTVAGLLGHTTTRMLEQHYSHIDSHDDHMQKAISGIGDGK